MLQLWTEPVPMDPPSVYWDEIAVVHTQVSGYRFRSTLVGPDDLDIDVQMRQWAGDIQPDMSIQFNPSHQRPLASVERTHQLAAEVWEDTKVLASHKHDASGSRIIRLDIAADFAPIEDMDAVFQALRLAQPRKGWTKHQIVSQGRRGGQTVMHFTKTAGTITAYDKSAEAQLDRPTLRIEARVIKHARKRHGMVILRDLTEDAARCAFTYMVEPFTNSLEARTGTVNTRSTNFRPRQAVEAIGRLYLRERGIENLFPLDRPRQRMLDAVIKELGILSVDDLPGA